MSMKITVFNVEHGFCAFLKTPSKYTMLIDCGCTEKFSPALYICENEFGDVSEWNGRKLTRMTVTHPHDDHIEDITTVKEVCVPAILLHQKYDWEDVKTAEDGDYENLDTYSAWQESYNTTPTVYPDYGMSIESFMLSPSDAKKVDEAKYINNSSIVTVATVQGSRFQERFLFGGDMETAGWEALLKQNANFKEAVKGVDFFIVSHHGHSSGFSDDLFRAMERPPILNIVSIHHNDEHIDDRYSKEDYASGTSFNGETRRKLTTRSDGSVTVNVTDEGKYWLSAKHLPDNRETMPAKGPLW